MTRFPTPSLIELMAGAAVRRSHAGLRQVVPTNIRALGSDEVEVIAATGKLVRQDGFMLPPAACDLRAYRANPIVLWQHVRAARSGGPMASRSSRTALFCGSNSRRPAFRQKRTRFASSSKAGWYQPPAAVSTSPIGNGSTRRNRSSAAARRLGPCSKSHSLRCRPIPMRW